jgi:hypothetical protein
VDGEAERRGLANTLAWAVFREPAFVTRKRLILLGEEGLAEFVAHIRRVALILMRHGGASPASLPDLAQGASAAVPPGPGPTGRPDLPAAQSVRSSASRERPSSPAQGHPRLVGRPRLVHRDCAGLVAACLAAGFAIGFAVAALL